MCDFLGSSSNIELTLLHEGFVKTY